MLAYMGFSGLAVQEERSFAEPGKRIGSELVTIVDDATEPGAMPMAFDYEGVAKQRVVLVERGVCRDVVCDAPDRGPRRPPRRRATACPRRTPHSGRIRRRSRAQCGACSSTRLPHGARAPLVIDQFEEVFTLCTDVDERRKFIATVAGAAPTSWARRS